MCVCRGLKATPCKLRRTSRDEGDHQNCHHSGCAVRHVARFLHDLRRRRLVHVVPSPSTTVRLLLLARLRQLGCQSRPVHGLQGRVSSGVPPTALPSTMLSITGGGGARIATAARPRLLGALAADLASSPAPHLLQQILTFDTASSLCPRRKYCDQRICMSVCLSTHISQKPCVRISRNFMYLLPVTVAQFFAESIMQCYVLSYGCRHVFT